MVFAAYQDVAEAFDAYDDALLDAYDEVTPLEVYRGTTTTTTTTTTSMATATRTTRSTTPTTRTTTACTSGWTTRGPTY